MATKAATTNVFTKQEANWLAGINCLVDMDSSHKPIKAAILGHVQKGF